MLKTLVITTAVSGVIIPGAMAHSHKRRPHRHPKTNQRHRKSNQRRKNPPLRRRPNSFPRKVQTGGCLQSSEESHLNTDRNLLEVAAVHNRGRVWRRLPGNRRAAIRNPRGRIATEGHTRGAPAQRHTELCTAVARTCVVAGRTQVAGRSRLAVYSWGAIHRRTGVARTRAVALHGPVANHNRRVGAHNQGVAGSHPRRRQDQEMRLRRAALPGQQSQ
jgi:hypothetical protein